MADNSYQNPMIAMRERAQQAIKAGDEARSALNDPSRGNERGSPEEQLAMLRAEQAQAYMADNWSSGSMPAARRHDYVPKQQSGQSNPLGAGATWRVALPDASGEGYPLGLGSGVTHTQRVASPDVVGDKFDVSDAQAMKHLEASYGGDVAAAYRNTLESWEKDPNARKPSIIGTKMVDKGTGAWHAQDIILDSDGTIYRGSLFTGSKASDVTGGAKQAEHPDRGMSASVRSKQRMATGA